jgi:tRNA(fMet)-specific endonuclease VapC
VPMKIDRLVIDAVAAVDYLNPARSAPPSFDSVDHLILPLPVPVELRFGALNAAPSWRGVVTQQLKEFVSRCELLLPTAATADFYAQIRSQKTFPPNISAKRQVHLLNDLWTAALCVQHQLPLLSNDRDFEGITGLVLIRW